MTCRQQGFIKMTGSAVSLDLFPRGHWLFAPRGWLEVPVVQLRCCGHSVHRESACLQALPFTRGLVEIAETRRMELITDIAYSCECYSQFLFYILCSFIIHLTFTYVNGINIIYCYYFCFRRLSFRAINP